MCAVRIGTYLRSARNYKLLDCIMCKSLVPNFTLIGQEIGKFRQKLVSAPKQSMTITEPNLTTLTFARKRFTKFHENSIEFQSLIVGHRQVDRQTDVVSIKPIFFT
jgi:hypothetical protein